MNNIKSFLIPSTAITELVNVLLNFDFKKVEKTMKQLKLRWKNNDEYYYPDITDLHEFAFNQLIDVYTQYYDNNFDEPISRIANGFKVTYYYDNEQKMIFLI